MIKILSIGNSFAQDAQKYLPAIAETDGIQIITGNLFIGGCSLETHWKNAISNEKEYEFQVNDNFVEKCSLKEGIEGDNWDYITFQQSSGDSGIESTYYPFITDLSRYVRELAPDAVQVILQTWAYEIDSEHGSFQNYDRDQEKMYQSLKSAYEKAALAISQDKKPVMTFLCGDAVQRARKEKLFDYANGGKSLNRDGFHLHFTLGRYLAAAVWFETLTGRSILENSYVPFDPEFPYEISKEELEVLKKCAHVSK